VAEKAIILHLYSSRPTAAAMITCSGQFPVLLQHPRNWGSCYWSRHTACWYAIDNNKHRV